MYNFTLYMPTRIHFGKGQISHLSELRESGTKVLLVYGGGSIKRNGIYDTAVDILKKAGLTIYDLPGVEPNPRIESVRKGVEKCKAEGIDMTLAIGGGSTIDCAKVVAAGAKYDGDPWDLVLDRSLIKSALPIYSVVTLAATGSEMNPSAVISDFTKHEKWGTSAPALVPTMSILDPTYTFSVSKRQTAAGTADIMSHTFENYFSFETADVQKAFGEALLKVLIKNGHIALAEPDNYDARASLMWAATHAINGLTKMGNAPAWCVHPMEHELSAFYDITHGVGLAILTPVWMEHILSERTAPIFAAYGRNVWGVTAADDMTAAKAAIEKTKEFLFETLELPSSLRAAGINDKNNIEAMAEKASRKTAQSFVPLTQADIREIYEAAF